ALAKLVMGDGQATGVTDRLDLPGDPRGALALHVVAPERHHGVDQAARRVDFDDLAVADERSAAHLEARTAPPVRGDAGAEVVLAPDVGVGDRLPESLRGRLDVDLENLLHG